MRPRLLPVVVLLVLPGCVGDTGPGETPFLNGEEPPTASPRSTLLGGPVLAIGDSLMVGAEEHGHLGAILSLDGWDLETIAERGRSVGWALDEIEERDERVPRYVIVVLGSNPGFSSDGFSEDVEALHDALLELGARRVLWMPPHHPDVERYEEKIEILKELDRAERRLVVPDWGAELDDHPEWVVGDGVHLTEGGYAAMAVFIRDWLARLV